MTPLDYTKKYKRSDEFKTLLFWRGPLSQWWYSPFIINGEEYNCAEQYMMAQKARMFGDVSAATKIMRTKGLYTTQQDFTKYPKKQQALGRKVRNFDPVAWNAIARDLVLRATLAKFSQHYNLLAALASTEGYTLVEASPYDKVWGIGMGDNEQAAFNPSEWQGSNWLGYVLTETRRYLTE